MEEMLQNPQEAEVQMTTAHGVCDVRLKGTAFERYDGKQPCLDHEVRSWQRHRWGGWYTANIPKNKRFVD